MVGMGDGAGGRDYRRIKVAITSHLREKRLSKKGLMRNVSLSKKKVPWGRNRGEPIREREQSERERVTQSGSKNETRKTRGSPYVF